MHDRNDNEGPAPIRDSVAALKPLLAELWHHLGDKPTPNGQGRRGKRSGSPAPWNPEAAGVIFEVHAGVREWEATLSRAAKIRVWRRGGSDANTGFALDRLPYLASLVGGMFAVDTAREAERWLTHARVALGLETPPSDLPRQPGYLLVPCPYCHGRLKWQADREIVFCSNPRCKDSEGRRTLARIRRGAYSGENSVVFGDGMTLPPAQRRPPPDEPAVVVGDHESEEA